MILKHFPCWFKAQLVKALKPLRRMFTYVCRGAGFNPRGRQSRRTVPPARSHAAVVASAFSLVRTLSVQSPASTKLYYSSDASSWRISPSKSGSQPVESYTVGKVSVRRWKRSEIFPGENGPRGSKMWKSGQKVRFSPSPIRRSATLFGDR